MTAPVWTRYEVGAYAAGEGSLLIRPKTNPRTTGVIVCHGAGGNALQPWDPFNAPGFQAIVSAVAAAGYPMIAADLAGTNTWGDDAVITRMGNALTYLRAQTGVTGKVAIIGESMGHLSAMAWTAQNLTSVACVASLIGVADIQDVYTNGSGYTSAIDSCYSGGWSNTTYGPAHNPAVLAAAGKYAGLPWHCWYGSSDTTVRPATVTALAASIGATATTTAVSGGHAWSTVAEVPPADVVAFIQAHT